MRILREKLMNLEIGSLLDIATGTGQFIKVLKGSFKNYHQMIGIDTSRKALEIAKNNLEDDTIKFQLMSGEDLQFEDCLFDIVSLSNSIHHLSDYSKVFNEIKRVLKPDGMIIINEMFCDNQTESQLSHVYLHHLMGEIDTCMGRVHNPTYKRQELITILQNEGFHIIEAFDYKELRSVTKEEQEEEIKSLKELCDNKLIDIKDNEKYNELAKKAQEVKDYLDKYGLNGATQLIVFAQ